VRSSTQGVLLIAPILIAAALGGCAPGGDAASGASSRAGGRPPQGIPVAAIEARPRDLARTVTVTGPVEPIRTVPVTSLTAGTVLSVKVQEGDRVTAGQLMAELDGREASAQLERARALLANAEAAFRRAEDLRTRDLNSAAEQDAARSAYHTARADTELWSTRVDFTLIKAPVAGVVTTKHVERGGAVSAHQAMFEIADDAALVVRVRVSEMDVVRLEPGRPVTLQIDAYPGMRIPGRIRRIFPTADAASRLVPVEVELGPRPQGVQVRPGFLARVDFAIERREGVLAVPASAIGVSEDAQFVYVISADTLVRRPVRTGLTAAGWIEVVDGLAAGERVVSSGHVNLRPGAAVRISDAEGQGGS
jgi:RND family efflux transporter MFP subunit